MRGGPELVTVPDDVWDAAARRALARDAAAGRRVRVRRGVYADADDWADRTPEERALAAMRALELASRRRPQFSHWSAALLHRLPVRDERLGRVHMTVPEHQARGLVGVAAHRFDLDDEDVVEVQGLLCTSIARTAVDVAGAAPFTEGVATCDAALRLLAATGPAVLRAAADRAGARRARARIGEVLAFADGRSESVGESVSRCSMRAAGLPAPVLQHTIRRRGVFVARVDFWFPEERVVGEMDGRGKYLDPAMNGGDPARAVWHEKRREDRVRPLVDGFVRWSFEEGSSPRRLAALLAVAGVLPRR